MKTRLYLFAVIIILCACARKSNLNEAKESIMIIDLSSEPESELTLLSDIATELEYIPLQTTENSLVRSITKIITRDGNIYFLNRFNEILCFDQEGRFLYKLNKEGRGPGEYTSITDFDVSSDNNTLFILSGNRILIYDNSGTGFLFDKDINLNRTFPSKISLIPGTTNILISVDPRTGTETSLSMVIAENGDTLYSKQNHYMYEKKDELTRGMVNESLHFSFEDNVCFKEEFSDTVFSIKKGANVLFPKLIIDSHGQGISPRIRYDSEYAKAHANEFYWVYSIMETERYVIYTFEHNRSRNRIIYDKSEDKKHKIALKDALNDDIAGGPVLNLDFCCDGKVYSVVEAFTLKNYITSDIFNKKNVKDSGKKEKLKKLADTLDEMDNPILISVTLKK